jgi:hypothetical protein
MQARAPLPGAKAPGALDETPEKEESEEHATLASAIKAAVPVRKLDVGSPAIASQ